MGPSFINIMEDNKYDRIFLNILQDQGHVLSFLDVVFGFMYRCTDLFEVKHKTDEKLGYDSGIAENVVIKLFHKWSQKAKEDKRCMHSESTVSSVDSVFHPSKTVNKGLTCNHKEIPPQRDFQGAVESYNGAVREGYRWSQTITDLDVHVAVPVHITKAHQMQVIVTAKGLEVRTVSEDGKVWNSLVKGDFIWKTINEDSLWTLEPGKHVQIHLEKCSERWWDSLFIGEPKIDVTKIDASRPLDELSQVEQMKIAELMWRDDKKKRGIPVSDNHVEDILREAMSREVKVVERASSNTEDRMQSKDT